jgi:hypothetical protein
MAISVVFAKSTVAGAACRQVPRTNHRAKSLISGNDPAKLGNAQPAKDRSAAFRNQPSTLSGPDLEHDPEKWEPVFGKDHAQTRRKRKSGFRWNRP